MKRFQFRLDRLLKVREYHEREWEIRMGDATRACVRIENELESLAVERTGTLEQSASSREEVDPTQASVVDIDDRLTRQRYLELIDHRVADLNATLSERELEREQVREKLSEASRLKKVLDKLKERKQQEYHHSAGRQSGILLDEIAGNSVVRNRQKGEDRV